MLWFLSSLWLLFLFLFFSTCCLLSISRLKYLNGHFYTYKSISTISWKNGYFINGMGYTGNAFYDMQFCLARMNTRKDPLNPIDPYLMCFFYIFLFYPSASSPMRHVPPSRALSRAGRPNATCPRLGFRPPPNNLCPGRRLPPRLGPPNPRASALHPARRVVDHKSVLLVSFCQDVMQVGRAKPTCLSSVY
jgi:hypothetical protein